MGNKLGTESAQEERRIKEEREKDKSEKERKKKDKKLFKRRKKNKKEHSDGEDSEEGSSLWSEKSQISAKSADNRSIGSAHGSWYHSASEPSSRRSSVYLPASAGPGYYQHDCWYPGYEDTSSVSSKSRSRTPSIKEHLNVKSGGPLDRYPLGVPTQEAIEPIHKGGPIDLSAGVTDALLKGKIKQHRKEKESPVRREQILTKNEDIDIKSSPKISRTDIVSYTFNGSPGATLRGEKRKINIDGQEITNTDIGNEESSKKKISSRDAPIIMGQKLKAGAVDPRSNVLYSTDDEDTKRNSTEISSLGGGSVYYSADEGGSVVDRSSVGGSIYYSADEGGSVAGSVYYSLTSGSEVEDYGDERFLMQGDRPSPPSKPEAVDREGGVLSSLAYYRVENDALLLRWDAPVTDGGSPVTGYIIEKCEAESDFWVRVNLIPVKDLEYAIAHLHGGRSYVFRVSAENAIGVSDPSPTSDIVSVTSDQEATEPHFLRELRNIVALEGQKVEFSVDVIGTPMPDVTWYKDEHEVFDTKAFEFKHIGDRYILVLKKCQIGDEGDVTVRATNRAGVASSQATFRVEALPQVQIPDEYEEGLIFETDEIIRLKVPYSGRPQPTAVWTHNGKTIDNDERHSTDVTEKFVLLKITGANRSDKGIYSVKLSNPHGECSQSLFVTVTDRPGPPSRPEIADMAGQALTLRWEAPTDDGGCRITNYIVEYFRIGWDVWLKATSSNITWAQMDELIVGSEYRFRVKAENAYGISEPSKESLQILIEEGKSDPGSFESGNATPSPALKRKEQEAGVLLSVDIASETSSDAGSFEIPENRKQMMRDRMSDSSSDIHSEGEKTFTGSATKEVDEDVTVIVAPRRKVVEESLSESGDFQEPEDTENVEEFLGDYLNRWEAYGGQSFGKELLKKGESTYGKENIPAEEYEIYLSKKKAIEQAEEILRELEEDNFVVEKEGVSPLQRFDEEEAEAKPKIRKHVPRTSSPRKDEATAYQKVLPTDDHARNELYDYAESERLYENITDNLIFQKEEDFQRKKKRRRRRKIFTLREIKENEKAN